MTQKPEAEKERFSVLLRHEAWKTFRNIVAFVAGCVVLWNFAEPKIDGWAEQFLEPLTDRLEIMETSLTDLRTEVGKKPPFIEFKGIGRVMRGGPFEPGQTVPVLYNIRRNQPCSTDVRVQFYSAMSNSVVTNLTYVIPSTQASASFDFIAFPVSVRIPDHTPSGWYAYAPLLIPDRTECPAAKTVAVAPSQFFYVERPE